MLNHSEYNSIVELTELCSMLNDVFHEIKQPMFQWWCTAQGESGISFVQTAPGRRENDFGHIDSNGTR
jgi:hypothetical protein